MLVANKKKVGVCTAQARLEQRQRGKTMQYVVRCTNAAKQGGRDLGMVQNRISEVSACKLKRNVTRDRDRELK